MKIPRWLGRLAGIVTLAFWCACVAVPVAALLSRVSGSSAVFGDPDVLRVAVATARQACVSALFSVALGLPLGLLAARASPRIAAWVDTLLLLPQGVPTVVAATAWVAWLGRGGVLARLDIGYSLAAVIVAHVFFNAPWVALLVAQARRGIAQEQLDAAATLGASGWSRLRWVVWPEIRWACGAAAAQTLAVCSMSFALVLILGGGPPVETLETALYSRLRGGALDLSGAAACAAWEMALTLAPWLLVLFLRGRARSSVGLDRAVVPAARRGDSSRGVGGMAGGFAGLIAAAFFVPYFSVFSGLFSGAGVSADFWSDVSAPLRLSVLIACLSALGALLAASLATVAVAWVPGRLRAWAGAALALPSGLSVLVLGLGGWLAYGRWIDPFEGSLGAIVALQITVFFPVAFRMLWPVAQAAQKSAMEAAWTLGASPWRAFWCVDWPRFRAPVFSALALVAGLALGEVAAVSLFYSEKLIPLPLLVSRWMGQYRFEDARAVSALLLAGAMALMIGVSGLGRSRVENG